MVVDNFKRSTLEYSCNQFSKLENGLFLGLTLFKQYTLDQIKLKQHTFDDDLAGQHCVFDLCWQCVTLCSSINILLKQYLYGNVNVFLPVCSLQRSLFDGLMRAAFVLENIKDHETIRAYIYTGPFTEFRQKLYILESISDSKQKLNEKEYKYIERVISELLDHYSANYFYTSLTEANIHRSEHAYHPILYFVKNVDAYNDKINLLKDISEIQITSANLDKLNNIVRDLNKKKNYKSKFKPDGFNSADWWPQAHKMFDSLKVKISGYDATNLERLFNYLYRHTSSSVHPNGYNSMNLLQVEPPSYWPFFYQNLMMGGIIILATDSNVIDYDRANRLFFQYQCLWDYHQKCEIFTFDND